MEKTKMKKIANVALNVLMYIFLALCILSVILTVASKKSPDGAAEVFGYQMRIVVSDSMEKCEYTDVSDYKIKSIPIRSMVFVESVPDDPAEAEAWYADLEVGDVLTFRYVYARQETITHRITSITPKEGGYIIELAGDNKTSEDGQLYQTIDTSIPNSADYVLGEVKGQAYLLGLILSFLTQPIGLVLVVIVPCLVIILLESMKIAKILGEDKKKRVQEENEKRESELEELRRKLAAFEQNTENKTEQPQASGGVQDSEATKDEE